MLGRPRSLERCKPNPNQPRTGVSWARLFMCVDVLGIVGEVNEHQHQPQTGISWASLVMCVDVLDIVGEVSQSQHQPQTGAQLDPKPAPVRPQTFPTSNANIPVIDRNSFPKRAPKSIPNRPPTGPSSAPNRPEIEAKLAQNRPVKSLGRS